MSELFEEKKDNSREVADLAKKVAELAEKHEALSKEKAMQEAAWQAEKSKLESTVNDLRPWADSAKGLQKMADENPDELMRRVIENKQKLEASRKKATSSESLDVSAAVKPLAEKIEKLEKEAASEREERKIAEMQNAIVESLESLASEGVKGDPKEILQFMRTKGLKDAEHVDLAARSLYGNALIEAKVNKKRKEKSSEEAVVMSNSGFNSDEETGAEEESEETPASRPKAMKNGKPNDYFNDDKLWKTLEKSI
jgi:hypothetical protein